MTLGVVDVSTQRTGTLLVAATNGTSQEGSRQPRADFAVVVDFGIATRPLPALPSSVECWMTREPMAAVGEACPSRLIRGYNTPEGRSPGIF